MYLYERHILKNLFPPLLIITFVIVGVVWITQTLKLVSLINLGVNLSDFLALSTLVIPSLLFMMLPFITVLGVVYTYHRLSDERQITVLKNAGLSYFQLAKPALIISIATTMFAYLLSAYVMPVSYNKFKTELDSIKNSFTSTMILDKTFYQISRYITIYVEQVSPNGEMNGLILFDNRVEQKPSILFANSGTLQQINESIFLDLKNGIRQGYDLNNNHTTLDFDLLSVDLTSSKNVKEAPEWYNKDINSLYIQSLLFPKGEVPEARKNKLVAEGHQRLIWPLYNIILPTLALALFLRQPNNRKSYFKHLLTGIVSVIIVTYLHFTLQNLLAKTPSLVFACYINMMIPAMFSILIYSKKTLR